MTDDAQRERDLEAARAACGCQDDCDSDVYCGRCERFAAALASARVEGRVTGLTSTARDLAEVSALYPNSSSEEFRAGWVQGCAHARTEHATVAARARAEALTIAQAQRGQPWVLPYSAGVELARQAVPHILASHCVLHAIKSVGKLAAVFEGLDHKDSTITDAEISTVKAMSADLMTAALRFANLYGFDLETELVARVVEKNGVGFWGAPPPAEPAPPVAAPEDGPLGMNFPRHINMHLEHNPHRAYYQTVPQYCEDSTHFDWVSGTERALAEATGEMWVLQWYPDTPIGFCAVAAQSLEALMAHVAGL